MGKIYQRGKTWYSNYWFGGQRIRKPLSENKRLALQMQAEMVAANQHRKHGLIPSQLALDVFLGLYLKIRKGEKRPNTYAHTDLAFRRLQEAFPIKQIGQITPELLEHAKIRWKEQGYRDAAIGSYVMQIKVAMKTAEAWKYIGAHPWHLVKGYVSPGRLIYYSMDDFRRLVEKTSGWGRTAILLMGRAGLRSGEVRHLEWTDIDFEAGTIWIHPKSFWKPKGWKPNKPHERHIDMPVDLQEHLQGLHHTPGFVLGHDRVGESAYARYFDSLIKGAGLTGSAHSLRHTYATHLISSGATLEEIGELLGHTNPMTTKIYAHLMPQARKRAVARLPYFVSNL